MSTTFGVLKPEYEDIISEEFYKDPEAFCIEVAFRSNKTIKWLNPLAELLPDSTEVHPLDNTAQGIHKIKDIKDYINETGE